MCYFIYTSQQTWELGTLIHPILQMIWFFATPWTAAHQASLSFSVSQSLLKLMSIELVIASNHLILCQLLWFYISNSR